MEDRPLNGRETHAMQWVSGVFGDDHLVCDTIDHFVEVFSSPVVYSALLHALHPASSAVDTDTDTDTETETETVSAGERERERGAARELYVLFRNPLLPPGLLDAAECVGLDNVAHGHVDAILTLIDVLMHTFAEEGSSSQ
ncbi:hypothetical protein KIPB_013928, partial [Kipferlia bialata]|eukprot:g13928.t1